MRSIALRVRDLLQPGSSAEQGTPLAAVPFVVVDTELTGLDPRRDAVVSIAALRMTGTRIELGGSFARLVQPRSGITAESVPVHGITPGDVAGQPPAAEAAAELRAFCGTRVLVGHALALDLTFLARDAEAFRAAELRRRAVDTAVLEEWIGERRERRTPGRGDAGERTLVATARRRGIPTGGAHDALRDAFITAQLFQRQLRELPSLGVRTLGDLLRVGKI